jgi:hypothetical protein
MLLEPLGAMNGCWGTVGADTLCGLAVCPMNAGTAASSRGSWGMGTGGRATAGAGRPVTITSDTRAIEPNDASHL